MKTKYTSFLILLFFLASCAEKKTEETLVHKETIQSKEKVDSSAIDADFVVSDTYDSKTMKDGKFESFYPDKTLKAEGMVTNGKREGVWTSYHPNGNKQSENEYVNGILHGKTFTTFPNGQIMYIGYYYDGKYDGQWVYYKADGELSKEIFYEKGEIKKLTEGKDYNK
jgi:antitoxin component YwqK of YwqJK toxin-antitoxin module